MENQKSGYIPLYRSVLKQAWAKDVYLRTLWENLLLNAARKPFMARFKGHDWHLQPGQLVVTAADLGLQLCDRKGNPSSRDAVERMLAVFVREGMITIEGEKQKGRVITITNYSEYAQKNDDLPAHKAAHEAAHTSAHGDTSNGAALKVVAAHDGAHGSAHTSAQHEQEGNNKNINNSTSENSDESSDARLKKFLSAHPDAAVYTPSGAKWGSAEDLEIAKWISSRVKLINPTCKAPDMTSWSNTVRLMRQIDNRSHQDICALYDWASKHHFWQTNILSPESLRKQWDKLTMQRNAGGELRAAKPDLDFNNTDWAYEVMR
ncbi:replication protein [Enterobacter hormaechei]|uniref:replication protein n=1 Tax=Enterobacter cloacae complex TaxID=354276 RepID=UPI0007352E67|nr:MULTISPECIES: replication protein [Enterobacter cloacae complex]KAA0866551.1 replication protein [Enterobacter hormaechei]KAA0872345.1 replication protein [Enterobacter hormaechei]KTK24259.1 replication protein [Enterobacter hormaechei subsp. xiangfangensis]KVJ78246.1 replication protein [Enterobacter hormaechei subsp. xiangfangensis]MBY7154374.1 replication protein [Enterobacter hormaechei]